MRAFTQLQGLAATIPGKNIDTDQIIPARFLKRSRTDPNYANYLFHDLRFNESDVADPEFVLNQPTFIHTNMLFADENFGCGSSREAAVYALEAFGIRAVIAPSFGDIFFNNCLKNGLLPIRLPQSDIDTLSRSNADLEIERIGSQQPISIFVDLNTCTIQRIQTNTILSFSIDPFWQECLLKGLDEIDLTLSYQASIDAFETKHLTATPWLTHPHT
jgi:3-isopropylmalate/(R)-2-methylmalate dehydratase small subunit